MSGQKFVKSTVEKIYIKKVLYALHTFNLEKRRMGTGLFFF